MCTYLMSHFPHMRSCWTDYLHPTYKFAVDPAVWDTTIAWVKGSFFVLSNDKFVEAHLNEQITEVSFECNLPFLLLTEVPRKKFISS